ncbi:MULTISPECIES: hypothetical protein [Bacillus]|uniref:hypothetical protein n=1 Tax=Bacillus TaxID=1386 RepID=UPI00031248B7|nr:hypothetical protein [Bacillus altitudinis]QKL22947.1 hypothetical protein RI02_15090 [Bacillus altitudinis]QKL26680.1 hypothetical protein EQK04_15090 [Bacillus altitudinis]QXY97058.1 hypothetical protein G4D59_14950 [Bacillus altitudinis]
MNVIKREVGAQGKGFRLQRLRAIKLLLDKMNVSEKAVVYSATEYLDDVYLKFINDGVVEEISEGDKNYDSKNSFSFMSNEVKNSMISFLDCWFQYESEGLTLCFYTNVKIGKENNSQYTKKLNLEMPKKPIIELLIEKNYYEDNLLNIVKIVLLHEYKIQYEGKKESGFLTQLKEMSDELWIAFLDKIDWKFEQENEAELEKTLIKDISTQRFYNTANLNGKESYVISALLDLFEKRQNVKDLLGRLITDSEVRRVLLEVATHNYKRNDPVYAQWEKIEPSDNRNLKEKIEGVAPKYNPKKLDMYARKIGAVKLELEKIDSREKSAYQYRIFEACEEKLLEILESIDTEVVSPEQVDIWVEEISIFASGHIDEKSKDFAYPFKNKDTLKNTILELFDSCYLSFDR